MDGLFFAAPDLRRFGFGSRNGLTAAATHAVTEFFALLGSHAFPALGHASAESGAAEAAATDVAEKNAAEPEHSDGLPERQLAPAKERWEQPVPQLQDQLPANESKENDPDNGCRGDEKPFFSDFIPSSWT